MGGEPKPPVFDLPARMGLAIAMAAVLVICGFWAAKASGDATWAARFGAVIIAFGLVFLLLSRKSFGLLRAEKDEFDYRLSRAIDTSAFNRASNRFADEMNKAGAFARQKNLILTEAWILLIGTIQWGFGDLLANRMLFCGDWTC